MTDLALRCGHNVAQGFTGRSHAVVATAAVVRYLGVIKLNREPAIAVVTATALGCGHNVICALTYCAAAIMATAAAFCRCGVIKVCR